MMEKLLIDAISPWTMLMAMLRPHFYLLDYVTPPENFEIGHQKDTGIVKCIIMYDIG